MSKAASSVAVKIAKALSTDPRAKVDLDLSRGVGNVLHVEFLGLCGEYRVTVEKIDRSSEVQGNS